MAKWKNVRRVYRRYLNHSWAQERIARERRLSIASNASNIREVRTITRVEMANIVDSMK